MVTIRAARHDDLPRLVEIEDAAETTFPALSLDFDPLPGGTTIEELVPYAETGRGLGLVRAVSDGVRIEPTPFGGTRVTVTFRHAVPALATTA